LFTSLLVQATTVMISAGSRVDADGRSRTRSFRQSFLHAYAIRIGQRLREATDQVGDAMNAARGGALVPVMAARTEAVRHAAESIFGEVMQRVSQIGNAEGWIAGTAAADRAQVNARQALPDT
jgi:hypothetical protein